MYGFIDEPEDQDPPNTFFLGIVANHAACEAMCLKVLPCVAWTFFSQRYDSYNNDEKG